MDDQTTDTWDFVCWEKVGPDDSNVRGGRRIWKMCVCSQSLARENSKLNAFYSDTSFFRLFIVNYFLMQNVQNYIIIKINYLNIII